MTLVMSYVILIAAAIGACVMALDVIAERRRMPRRWLWVSALAVTLVTTGLAMVVPISATGESENARLTGSALALGSPTTAPLAASSPPPPLDDALLTAADAVLPIAWFVGSLVLLLAIASGRRTLRRERKRAQATELAGHPILLSDSLGPAVAGVRAPVVFMPKWVLALDEASQRLLLAHEAEHVKQHDTAVLFAGALAASLVPWNPVVWWIVRRLRLAVEQDCDHRVLEKYPGVRRYADLLLLAASRPGVMTRLLAAHFGEHSSDLMRRIETMTRYHTISWRRLVPATAVASILLAAACETPRPAPVAPIDLQNEAIVPKAEPATTDLIEVPAESIEVSLTKIALKPEFRLMSYDEWKERGK